MTKYYGKVIGTETDSRKPSVEVNVVLIWGTEENPPDSMAEVENVGDDIVLAVGSAYLDPDGGVVWFWLGDDDWHRWGG